MARLAKLVKAVPYANSSPNLLYGHKSLYKKNSAGQGQEPGTLGVNTAGTLGLACQPVHAEQGSSHQGWPSLLQPIPVVPPADIHDPNLDLLNVKPPLHPSSNHSPQRPNLQHLVVPNAEPRAVGSLRKDRLKRSRTAPQVQTSLANQSPRRPELASSRSIFSSPPLLDFSAATDTFGTQDKSTRVTQVAQDSDPLSIPFVFVGDSADEFSRGSETSVSRLLGSTTGRTNSHTGTRSSAVTQALQLHNDATNSRLLRQFRIMAELGRGAFGVVLQVQDTIDLQLYAIKVIPLRHRSGALPSKEAQLLSSMNHPNVSRYNTVWKEDLTPSLRSALTEWASERKPGAVRFEDSSEVLLIQMELFSTNLRQFIRQRKEDITARSDGLALRIMRDVAAGVGRCHRQGLIHRDIKPSNLLLKFEQDRFVKGSVGDFGLSTKLSGHLEAGVGTITYSAPEQKNSTGYTEAADVYSLGLILYEVLSLWSTDAERSQRFRALKHGRELDPSFVRDWPCLAHLVLRSVSLNPVARPTAEEFFEEVCASLARFGSDEEEDFSRSRQSLVAELRALRSRMASCAKEGPLAGRAGSSRYQQGAQQGRAFTTLRA